MASFGLLFFLSIILIHLLLTTQGQICSNTDEFSTNSTYGTNLNLLLSSLPSFTTLKYGFYNTTAGQNPNKVYSLFLCRVDVPWADCRKCVNTSSHKITRECPNQKEAITWDEVCMLRYSNREIFSHLEETPISYVSNPNNNSDSGQFNKVLGDLMKGLVTRAASGGSNGLFAAGEANWTSSQESNIYGMVQCTPDISERDCKVCLQGAVGQIQKCCDKKQGGRVLKPSCNLRYEDFRFYDPTAVAAAGIPPPAINSPTQVNYRPPPIVNLAITDGNGSNSSRFAVIIAVPTVITVMLLCIICFIVCRRRRKEKIDDEDLIRIVESLQFDFGTIRAATENFSDANKLGQGGFGAVYKGTLLNGQEIAVKRLSRNSRQGDMEFKNEVVLVAKLQHRNLVRLLGFCMERDERLLIYEFVPNASLDHFIFDRIKRAQLGWEGCSKIIGGIARGLLYLHEDSRLRIIHRDLKSSNVLLDEEMKAKISDFGLARLFVVDETHGSTSRIAGTYGYMAPEYALHGKFSVKSDVYSFGVLLLEIVIGQKINCFYHSENSENLPGFVWRKWNEGTALDLLDPTFSESCSSSEVIRCIHVGLLCIQESVAARPTMASVVLMLNSNSVTLPLPSQPSFFVHSRTESELPSREHISETRPLSANEASITELYPR